MLEPNEGRQMRALAIALAALLAAADARAQASTDDLAAGASIVEARATFQTP